MSVSIEYFCIFKLGTYQCRKGNYEIILCPNGNSNINWNGNKWAMSCDFRGNDLSNALVPAPLCGPQCEKTPGCTHFAWTTYLGGTCWMKQGPISKDNAFSVDDHSAVCGVL